MRRLKKFGLFALAAIVLGLLFVPAGGKAQAAPVDGHGLDTTADVTETGNSVSFGSVAALFRKEITKYTVTINPNKGTMTGAVAEQISAGSTYTFKDPADIGLTGPKNFRFKGWFMNGNQTIVYQPGDTFAPEQDTTVSALWEYYQENGEVTLKVFSPFGVTGAKLTNAAGQKFPLPLSTKHSSFVQYDVYHVADIPAGTYTLTLTPVDENAGYTLEQDNYKTTDYTATVTDNGDWTAKVVIHEFDHSYNTPLILNLHITPVPTGFAGIRMLPNPDYETEIGADEAAKQAKALTDGKMVELVDKNGKTYTANSVYPDAGGGNYVFFENIPVGTYKVKLAQEALDLGYVQDTPDGFETTVDVIETDNPISFGSVAAWFSKPAEKPEDTDPEETEPKETTDPEDTEPTDQPQEQKPLDRKDGKKPSGEEKTTTKITTVTTQTKTSKTTKTTQKSNNANTAPKTGDDANPLVWGAGIVLAGLVIGGIAYVTKKERSKSDR